MLLPPRANTEYRLLCSECRKRNGDRDEGLRCFFHRWTTPADPEDVLEFELRERPPSATSSRDTGAAATADTPREGVVEWLVQGASSPQWEPYTGDKVFCLGCLDKAGTYVIYDPRTRQVVTA